MLILELFKVTPKGWVMLILSYSEMFEQEPKGMVCVRGVDQFSNILVPLFSVLAGYCEFRNVIPSATCFRDIEYKERRKRNRFLFFHTWTLLYFHDPQAFSDHPLFPIPFLVRQVFEIRRISSVKSWLSPFRG